ncbi:hypothetical protein [Paraburkholderia sacchari]|uniref:Uncharacterized protein n=1 Tax=Paraburkholderia sacchari TaxID=159450 RepID=A0A8T6Z6C0_9BURK|nr:hypothetical protein [Paraburkholderia sacchari]NLP59830.1 hypothetical protein [Paraburkholderia sacchari]
MLRRDKNQYFVCDISDTNGGIVAFPQHISSRHQIAKIVPHGKNAILTETGARDKGRNDSREALFRSQNTKSKKAWRARPSWHAKTSELVPQPQVEHGLRRRAVIAV